MDTIHISELLPKSLDEVIRLRRDLCRLTLASADELKTLTQDIPHQPVKQTLYRWQILAFHFTTPGQNVTTYHLVGRVRGSGAYWMTSKVTGLDREHRRIRTQNAIYGVWGKSGVEADINLSHVCATLNLWGIGPKFGVAPLFF